LFGWPPAALAALRTFAVLGYHGDDSDSEALSAEDLGPFLETPASEHMPAILQWAEMLGYVRLQAANRWVLNRMLTRALRNG
jgi:hypothetical protein